MSEPDAPAWLAGLQADFGAVLRTPLDRARGFLRAPEESYARGVVQAVLPGHGLSPQARLSVYHRQYWFRLLSVMQTEYPLTAALLGMWHFNGLSAAYLAAHPSRSVDVQRATTGFVEFLSATLRQDTIHFDAPDRTRLSLPGRAVYEAAALDAAFSGVFLAPESAPFVPSPAALAELLSQPLLPSPTLALYEEHHGFVEARRAAVARSSEAPMPLPPAHPSRRFWAIFRTERGHGVVELEPLAHQLFTLATKLPFGQALARVEAACPEAARAQLPARVHHWLAESVRSGFWLPRST
jgi:hypothetical protein